MRFALVCLFLSSVAYAEPTLAPPTRESPGKPPLILPRYPQYTPYWLRLDIDLPLLVIGTALWAGTSAIGGSGAPPPWCGTDTTPACDRNGVNAFDRIAFDRFNETDRVVANALVGIVPGAFTLLDIFDTGITHWRGWLTDAAIITEAVVWTGAIQDIVRRAVRRPRPFMYTPGLNASERNGAEAAFSFFSGHTSNLFAMTTAAAFTYHLRHPGSKWRWLVWTAAFAGASVEPVLRVLAGDHFPTDCLIGAAVGTGAGFLFPALHRRKVPITITSSSGPNQTTVGVAGSF
jgi:membrane-associated phospholipid phosphatase